LASLAFFYCDFRDTQKQDRRGLVTSFPLQLGAQSDSYSNILSNVYSSHRRGLQHASNVELEQCLTDMLKLPDQAPIYVVVDGLDECPKSHGLPSPRTNVLNFVKELVGLHLPNLYI
jgi:hypothetical protein